MNKERPVPSWLVGFTKWARIGATTFFGVVLVAFVALGAWLHLPWYYYVIIAAVSGSGGGMVWFVLGLQQHALERRTGQTPHESEDSEQPEVARGGGLRHRSGGILSKFLVWAGLLIGPAGLLTWIALRPALHPSASTFRQGLVVSGGSSALFVITVLRLMFRKRHHDKNDHGPG